MHHYLKLDLAGWSAKAIERMQNAPRLTIKHPDRTTPDHITPSEFVVRDKKTYCNAKVGYGWVVPPYSMLNIGTRIVVSKADPLFGQSDNAVVANRWEEPATRVDWENEHIPDDPREELDYSRDLTPNEFRWLSLGENPSAMEDKWFQFFEDGILYFHRSWTGLPVFKVAMQPNRITQAWRVEHPKNPAISNVELLSRLIELQCDEARRVYDV